MTKLSPARQQQLDNRVAKGDQSGKGGEWLPTDATRKENVINIFDTNVISRRAQQLFDEGYIEPVATHTPHAPHRTDDVERDLWWGSAQVTGEYGNPDGSYPQMPDDYTPKKTFGRALTGHRRTHRRTYRGNDVELKMPSAASIKRFAEEQEGKTFDVPISFSTAGGEPVAGWVRVTKGSNGLWSSKALGFGADGEFASESVKAVLEARRPTMALSSMSDVLERHRRQQSLHGTEAVPIDSSFIKDIGYDPETQTCFVSMKQGKTKDGLPTVYEYRGVHPDDYRVMEKAGTTAGGSAGKAYNRIKQAYESGRINKCPNCGRFSSSVKPHVCPPPKETQRVATPAEQNRRAEEAIKARLARITGHNPPPTAPTPPPAAAAEPFGSINVGRWGQELWDKAHEEKRASTHRTLPGVTPGFTLNPEITTAIEMYAGKEHTPHRWRPAGTISDKGNELVERTNGDDNLIEFDNLQGQSAIMLLNHLPEGNLNYRVSTNAPTVGNILSTVVNSNGKITAHGILHPPHSEDEAVAISGIHVNNVDTSQARNSFDEKYAAALEAKKAGIDAKQKPETMMKVADNPDGTSNWLLVW